MPLPELDDLLRSVEAETVLGDWGDETDPGFTGRVGQVLEAAKQHLSDEDDLKAAEDTFRWHLSTRLGLFADRAAYRTAEQVIDAPLVVMGEPRAGTTLLHALLAEDPASRAVRFWELYYPSPPPGAADAASVAARQVRADDDWRQILALIPEWLVSHPYNDQLGQGLAECERCWAIDFRSTPPSGWWRVPVAGLAAGVPQDHVRQYELHRMTLQHLQVGAPPKRWALKGTSHHQRLAALLDAYPDGCFVWIHRDPVVTTASFLELISQIYEGITGHADRAAAAPGHVAGMRAKLADVMSNPAVDDPRIVHVAYHEFVGDPAGTIGRLYDRFGIDFDDAVRAGIEAWLAGNRSDRYGRFTYSVDALGVDPEELYEEFAPYLERFGVRRELAGRA